MRPRSPISPCKICVRVFGDEARRLSRSLDLKFADRKLSGGTLLNALALWFLARPEKERGAIAVKCGGRHGGFLAEPDEEMKGSNGNPHQ